MPGQYDDLQNKQTELIRKTTDGSLFIASYAADPIADITTATGTLADLPDDWDDLGWLTGDGMGFARDVTTSDVTSFGSTQPTRSDITADTTTLTATAQETKLLTIGLLTGVDLSAVVPKKGGEVSVLKPTRPNRNFYRLFGLAVDLTEDGEIYIGRILPRATPTSFAEQTYSNGDEALTYGVTFTGFKDSDLGYAERWVFGGPGWAALLARMGFLPASTT